MQLFIKLLVAVTFLFIVQSIGAQNSTASMEEKDTLAVITENNKITIITNTDTSTVNPETAQPIVNTANTCYPPCRPGYICHNGQCVSMCNPPCPPDIKPCLQG
jgi:hypothetical protein